VPLTEPVPSPDFFWWWPSGSRDTLVRERVSADKLGAACFGHRVSQPTLGPLGQPEKAMGHESRIELWSPNLTTFCFVGFGTDRLRREQPMKTTRENQNRWAAVPSSRVHGAAVQNRSRSIMQAGKQEKLRPQEVCCLLTSPFIELIRGGRTTNRPNLAFVSTLRQLPVAVASLSQ
jgi:hypothetical protein